MIFLNDFEYTRMHQNTTPMRLGMVSKDFHQMFLSEKVRIERTVSHGNAFGMYALDPEGNTIEIYYRTGFPVPQPCADPENLQDSEESLIAQAKSRIPA